MANAALTAEQITALVGDLNYHKYLVNISNATGGSFLTAAVSLGPLASAPKLEADVETKETTLYETGDEPQAEILSKNNAKLTLETRNMDVAMSMLTKHKKGDNILAAANALVITLVPITADTTAKGFTFGNCYLDPGLSTTLSEGDDTPSSAQLVFKCKPDANGNVVSYAVVS